MLFKHNMQWREVEIESRPPARAWHTANAINDEMIVIGGTAGRLNFFAENIWILNTNSLTWRSIRCPNIPAVCSHT